MPWATGLRATMTANPEVEVLMGGTMRILRPRVFSAVAVTLALTGAVAGCAVFESSQPEPTAAAPSDSPTQSVSPSPTVPASAPPVSGPSIDGLPAELEGAWCSSLDAACFSFAQLRAQYPDVILASGDEISLEGPAFFEFCLTPDTAGTCDLASTALYEYFLPGVPWECQDAADAIGLPSCDPDYTSLHDISRARLLNVPNHQMNDLYQDVPPFYRED